MARFQYKLPITLLILFSLHSASAQSFFDYEQKKGEFSYGPKVGFSTSLLSMEEAPLGDPKIYFSYVVGGFVRYQFSNIFSAQFDLTNVDKGGRFESSNGNSTSIALNYIAPELRAILDFNTKIGTFNLNWDIFAGTSYGILTSARHCNCGAKGSFNNTLVNLQAGSSFYIGRLVFSASTKIGVTDANKNFVVNNSKPFIRNLSSEWTVGYRF